MRERGLFEAEILVGFLIVVWATQTTGLGDGECRSDWGPKLRGKIRSFDKSRVSFISDFLRSSIN